MFLPAERVKMRLLMAIIGPAGSGKSVTGGKILSYLLEGEPFFAIDTENGRLRQYATAPGEEADPENLRFNFMVAELNSYDPRMYLKAINEAVKAGAKGLLIDSMSHGWSGKGGILDQKNSIDMKGGNSFTNWGQMTKLQNELIETIMSLPMHVICTMRTKSEYVIEQNAQGRQVPKKVGLAPVQRDDVEYNFDIVGMMDRTHTMSFDAGKTTCTALDGEELANPGLNFVEKVVPWLNTGTRLPVTRVEFIARMKELGFQDERQDIALFVQEHPECIGVYRFNELLAIAEHARQV